MKKILSVIMAVALLTAIIPVGTFTASAATYSGTCGDNVTWEYDTETATLTISGTGPMYNYYVSGVLQANTPWRNLTIKTLVVESGVTYIGACAFIYCNLLTNISIPDSVTLIDDSAFSDTAWYDNQSNGLVYAGKIAYKYKGYHGFCSGNITIKDGTIGISDYLFENCSGLTGITIPASVITIGCRAFSGCTGLTSITIPNSVESIGHSAFYNCTGLTSITIPNSITIIGGNTFYGCSELVSITIGKSVNTIGYGAFNYCNSLDEITYVGTPEKKDNITIYGSNEALENATWYFLDGRHSNYRYLLSNHGDAVIAKVDPSISGNIIIPSTLGGYTVSEIGRIAFSNCKKITDITIPSCVTKINFCAFENCTDLKSIKIPSSVVSIKYSAFDNCSALESIEVDKNNTSYFSVNGCLIERKSKTLVTGCKNSNIPSDGSVKIIGENAFCGCTGLKSIVIPDKITSIENNAFHCCTGLTNINIPSSVKSIGWYAFYGCTGLLNIAIGSGVTTIGSGAFSNCKNVESITVSNDNAVYRSSGNCLIDDYKTVLFGCKNSVLPTDNSIELIDSYAFYNCEGLTAIVIPDSVEHICSGAFMNCLNLNSIDLPDTLISIDSDSFCNTGYYNNEKNWQSGLLYIGKHLIKANNSEINTDCIIRDGIKTIAAGAFVGCTRLKSLLMPSTIILIDSSAFYDCDNLYDVYYTGLEHEVENIGIDNSFGENDSLLEAVWHYNYFIPCDHTGGVATCHSRAICTLCGKEYGEFNTSNHNGGTEIRNAKAPTCTELGYTGDLYCFGCNKIIATGETIPTINHHYIWRTTHLATADKTGLNEEICSVCGNKSGNTKVLVYTGHITGDINDDGKINNKDLTRLFQKLSGWDVDVNEAALDINGDGKVNNKDLTRLFQYLSGWSVEIY